MYKDFDEYWGEVSVNLASYVSLFVLAKLTFAAAREGMIPESEALRIPPVSEWPDEAEGVYLGFYYAKNASFLRDAPASRPRPTDPGYKPQEGEVVFFLSLDPRTPPFLIGKVEIVVEKDGVADIRTPGGNLYRVHFASIKPFNANYIDAPDWESICPF